MRMAASCNTSAKIPMRPSALLHRDDPASPEPLFSLVLDQPERRHIHEFADAHRTFRIRCADSDGHRSSVSMLIDKMYGWRRYGSSHQVGKSPNQIVLMVLDHDHPIATATLGLDSAVGLLADELYKEEADCLRSEGRRLCEMTKLAVDHVVRSKRVLASLFHVSLIYGHHLHGRTDCLIEINPRHLNFYKTMLGFEEHGGLKMCPRVNAPARLLRLNVEHVESRIAALGGHGERMRKERSLFPYFFSKAEEEGIVRRLKTIH